MDGETIAKPREHEPVASYRHSLVFLVVVSHLGVVAGQTPLPLRPWRRSRRLRGRRRTGFPMGKRGPGAHGALRRRSPGSASPVRRGASRLAPEPGPGRT